METSVNLSDFWKFLALRTDAYEAARRSPASLWLSLRLFVLAGLIGSVGLLIGGLAQAGTMTFSDRLSSAGSSLASAGDRVEAWLPGLASTLDFAAERLRAAAAAIVSVQPPLGESTSEALLAFGAWISQPLVALTTWMTWLLPLLLVGRLMGGRGSLRQQVSLGLLAFLPQGLVLLSSFGLDPATIGATVAAVMRIGAALWSLAILIAAMAVANGYGRGQSAKVLSVTIVSLAVIAGVAAFLFDRLAGPLLSLLV